MVADVEKQAERAARMALDPWTTGKDEWTEGPARKKAA